MGENHLNFTQFVELVLALLVEADREQPGAFVDIFPLVEELREDVPVDWVFDARDALEIRGLVHPLKVMGRTAPTKLTGEGRLFVEQGGSTGIIDEYRQHPTNFVVVTGSGHQVAVGTGRDVKQTSVQSGLPEEVWEILDAIEGKIRSADALSKQQRQDALADLQAAREQLQRPEPNKRAALALLDPLAKLAAVGSFVTRLGEALA